MATVRKNRSSAPKSLIATEHIAVKPAAGPLTLSADLLISGINIPPMIPEISPVYTGAPDASDTPRHSGRATKKTVILDLKSCFRGGKNDCPL
jgi:hypothetical protein